MIFDCLTVKIVSDCLQQILFAECWFCCHLWCNRFADPWRWRKAAQKAWKSEHAFNQLFVAKNRLTHTHPARSGDNWVWPSLSWMICPSSVCASVRSSACLIAGRPADLSVSSTAWPPLAIRWIFCSFRLANGRVSIFVFPTLFVRLVQQKSPPLIVVAFLSHLLPVLHSRPTCFGCFHFCCRRFRFALCPFFRSFSFGRWFTPCKCNFGSSSS